MANVIGKIGKREILRRINHSKRLKYNKPLKVQLGPILRRALLDGHAKS